MSALWSAVAGVAVLVVLGLVRERRGVADMQRRQRVEGWHRRYSAARHLTGSSGAGAWTANLGAMTLHFERADFELRRVEQVHPNGPSEGTLPRWLQLETAASWAERCWRLHDAVAAAQLLRGEARRALRKHLATRPAWEAVDSDVALVLEDARRLTLELAAARPTAAEASYLAEAAALVRELDGAEAARAGAERDR